jgi:soluble lytic murein transglycosylase
VPEIARTITRVLTTAALFAAVAFAPAAGAAADLDRQRTLFTSALERAELGDWSGVLDLPSRDRALLESYVLWPDLEAAWLRATIASVPAEQVERFLATHGALKPARELRYRYALELARRGDLDAYYGIYAAHYAELADPMLDCLALTARIAAGRGSGIVDEARVLWRVGRSQVPECDPVFDWLKSKGLLTDADYRLRYAAAIDAEAFTLARWLARSMDESYGAAAAAWLDAQSNPEDFLLANGRRPADATAVSQLAYAAKRLTYRDPVRAHELWVPVAERVPVSEAQKLDTARHIALWTARDRLPGATERLLELPDAAVDAEVLRWRARISLYNGDWEAVLRHIAAMADDERKLEEWRFWRAMALRSNGGEALGNAELAALAGERSYYGFLAADELDEPYAFGHSNLEPDEALIEGLESSPELVRARELFFVGLDGRGRSEWDAAMSLLIPDLKRQAAILAHRWGWHSRAIATAAEIGEYDDLDLRYPLPYRDVFESRALLASIPATWALGIARSESLFMRDVRSGAGAIGLMQLMPATGRELADELKLPFSGTDTLTDPVGNIQLGTAYLGRMTKRFGGDRVLATAAYNAGPQRVLQWLPKQDPVDARVWIETIPYNETRRYVRRVLEAETIFHWRLSGETRRLSDEFAAVSPPVPAERVASSSR